MRRGTPVYSSDGVRVGHVRQILDNYREHIFDGLVFARHRAATLRFADAPEVARTAAARGDAERSTPRRPHSSGRRRRARASSSRRARRWRSARPSLFGRGWKRHRSQYEHRGLIADAGEPAAGGAFLAALGVGVATYIAIADSGGGAPACMAGGSGCQTVAESSYSHLAGVNIAIFGIVGYLLLLGAALLRRDAARMGGFALALGGFGFSVYLTYLELFMIEAICQWCVASAVLMTILFAAQRDPHGRLRRARRMSRSRSGAAREKRAGALQAERRRRQRRSLQARQRRGLPGDRRGRRS